jgi:hypothetical protein
LGRRNGFYPFPRNKKHIKNQSIRASMPFFEIKAVENPFGKDNGRIFLFSPEAIELLKQTGFCGGFS